MRRWGRDFGIGSVEMVPSVPFVNCAEAAFAIYRVPMLVFAMSLPLAPLDTLPPRGRAGYTYRVPQTPVNLANGWRRLLL